MKNFTTLIAAATFAALGVSIAQADTTFGPRSVTVRFADLDMTNSQGAAVLFRRIKGAAESVCRDLESGRDLGLIHRHANCVNLALGNAIVKIDRPAVTAYAAAHGVSTDNPTIKIADNK